MKNLMIILARSRLSVALLLAGSYAGLAAVVQAKEKTPAAGETAKHATAVERKDKEALRASRADIAARLREHPELVNDPEFLKSHPALRKFLSTHPKVKQALASKPKATATKPTAKQLERRAAKAGKTP